MDRLQDISPADLAGVYSEVAALVGIDNTYKIFHQFKGLQLMFPLKFYSTEFITRQIRWEYDEGKSVRDLARKYEYSESRVRQILRSTKKNEL